MSNICSRLHAWHAVGPLATLVLVLAYLWVDCKLAREEVSIKLLDGSLVHSSTFFKGTQEQQQQRPTDTRAARGADGAAAAAAAKLGAPDPGGSDDDENGGDDGDDSGGPQAGATRAGRTRTRRSSSSSSSSKPPAEDAESGSGGGQQREQAWERVVPDVSDREEDILPDVAAQVLAAERKGRGRKVISMSLFGSAPKYIQGAVENAMLAQRDWPGWTLRIYLGDGVPPNITALVRAFGGEIVSVAGSHQSRDCSTFWRFFALGDPTATRVLVRDADSRLTRGDAAAVAEWMNSSHLFHTTHDHEAHGWPVVGGAWGAVNGLVNPRLLEAWKAADGAANASCVWGHDQDWLAQVVWPGVKAHALQHASWHCGEWGAAEVRGWPTQRQHDRDMRVVNVHDPFNEWRGLAYWPECPPKCRRKPEWTRC